MAADTALPAELAVTEAVNGWPRWIGAPLEAVMQLGARPAIVVVAAVALVIGRRRWWDAATVGGAGVAGWAVSRAAKELIERPRPSGLGADVVVRDGAEGFGFPSTHVAVATALLVAVAVRLGARTGAVAGVVVAVALGRLYVGVHGWLDVLGGAAVGAAAGLGADRVSEYVRRR